MYSWNAWKAFRKKKGKNLERKKEMKTLFPWKFSWYFLLMTHHLPCSEVKELVPCSKQAAHWMSCLLHKSANTM